MAFAAQLQKFSDLLLVSPPKPANENKSPQDPQQLLQLLSSRRNLPPDSRRHTPAAASLHRTPVPPPRQRSLTSRCPAAECSRQNPRLGFPLGFVVPARRFAIFGRCASASSPPALGTAFGPARARILGRIKHGAAQERPPPYQQPQLARVSTTAEAADVAVKFKSLASQ